MLVYKYTKGLIPPGFNLRLDTNYVECAIRCCKSKDVVWAMGIALRRAYPHKSISHLLTKIQRHIGTRGEYKFLKTCTLKNSWY